VKLADFVTADRAVVPLQQDTVTAAAWSLLERLVAAGALSHGEKLRRRVAEERPEDIVAMGDRAFLLHYRTDAVSDIVVAIGTSPEPICRELGENETQCARVVLLVIAPPRMPARYLQVVGAFARVLSKANVVAEVLAQPTAEALAALPVFAEYELSSQLTVREIMTDRPKTISPETSLKDAARDLVRLGVGGLPVVDEEGRVIGMLGERELMQTMLNVYLQGSRGGPERPPGQTPARLTVRDAMNRKVLCVSPDQPLADVSSMMTNKDVDRVPVVRDGRIVGLLTRGDIVRRLLGY
jgi:CBS domain-containing protein